MKIALIGYGAMGQLIERLAKEKSYETVRIGRDLSGLDGCDAAIDFTVGEAVRGNVERCVAANVPLVEGTTGWSAQLPEIEEIVREGNGAMVYGANFSIGVNLFYKIVDHAAGLTARIGEYDSYIEERHHSRKRDSPSGTALRLENLVEKHLKVSSVASTRAGSIPGTHRVGFDSAADQIELTHTARSREGFAAGAILAAEWIRNKRGLYEFGSVIDEILSI